jgi:hypothetical protein
MIQSNTFATRWQGCIGRPATVRNVVEIGESYPNKPARAEDSDNFANRDQERMP